MNFVWLFWILSSNWRNFLFSPTPFTSSCFFLNNNGNLNDADVGTWGFSALFSDVWETANALWPAIAAGSTGPDWVGLKHDSLWEVFIVRLGFAGVTGTKSDAFGDGAVGWSGEIMVESPSVVPGDEHGRGESNNNNSQLGSDLMISTVFFSQISPSDLDLRLTLQCEFWKKWQIMHWQWCIKTWLGFGHPSMDIVQISLRYKRLHAGFGKSYYVALGACPKRIRKSPLPDAPAKDQKQRIPPFRQVLTVGQAALILPSFNIYI